MFREMRKVGDSVRPCVWAKVCVCVSRVSLRFARAYMRVLACAQNAEMYTRTPLFDPELALQLPET